jgi:putative transposase
VEQYHATVGTAPKPEWLHTQWWLSQFVRQPGAARAAYVDHVRAGVGLPSVWDERKNQLYLGDADFAQAQQQRTQRQAFDLEIPRSQRRSAAPALAGFTKLPERSSAMVQAYATGCYSMKDIAQAFCVHYCTVSRAVRAAEIKRQSDSQTLSNE